MILFSVNIEDNKPIQKKVEAPVMPVRVGDAEKAEEARSNKKTHKNTDKATDDMVYDKFKKHMRRF